ncbi:hypothetical protein CERSUDRAFT_121065, partial [Gelatoporia subvermispora B]
MAILQDAYPGRTDLQQVQNGGKTRPFPLELCEGVIDILCDDVAALVACSLTCRALIARTRRHIFRSVSLGDATQCRKLEVLLNRSAEASHDIAYYIRDLRLGSFKALGGNNAYRASLCAVLPHLIYVEDVSISDMHFNDNFLPLENIFTFSSEVRSLNLSRLIFYSPLDALRLFTAYPKLSAIRAHTVWMSPVDINGHPASRNVALESTDAKIAIRRLAFLHGSAEVSSDNSSWIGIPKMLLGSPFVACVSDLHWKFGSDIKDATVLADIVQRSGSSLVHLRLQLNQEPASVLAKVDLSNNDQLSSVTLDSIALAYMRGIYDVIPDFLSSITSSALHRISLNLFCFCADDVQVLDSIPWDRLDESLSCLIRTSSRLCVIVTLKSQAYTSPVWLEALASKMLALLPKAQARNVALEFTVCTIFIDTCSLVIWSDPRVIEEYWSLCATVLTIVDSGGSKSMSSSVENEFTRLEPPVSSVHRTSLVCPTELRVLRNLRLLGMSKVANSSSSQA